MSTYLLICLLFGIILPSRSISPQASSSSYSVLDFGAVGDGLTDDSQAFVRTFKTTCDSTASSPTMVIPGGKKYLIRPVQFTGSCRSLTVNVQISGEILGYENPSDWKCTEEVCGPLILFQGVNGLTISGGGTINGRGAQWWKNLKSASLRPEALRIFFASGVNITDLNFQDNPAVNLFIYKSETVNVKNVKISAPEDSPNTDGIQISSRRVTVEDSIIGTGGDCIAILYESSDLKARNISCGPGHGISIGGDTVNVEFRDVIFTKTSNGVTIKTLQDDKGSIRNITFDGIVSNGASNPLIIDQSQQSVVQIQDVTFKNVTGTSNTEVAVNFACSKTLPCLNITVKNINLLSVNGSKQTSSSCTNVKGTIEGKQVPSIPCLKQI